MRKILLICVLLIFSCNKSDDSTQERQVPDSFLIEIEIEGVSTVPIIHVSINSTVVNTWESENLPFNSQYTYNTIGNEIRSTACNCITISASAYLSQINDMSSFKLYVDGELVDSTTITNPPTSDGFINPTRLEFVY